MEHLREKTTKSESIYSGRVFNIKRDEVITPDGSSHIREVVLHNGGVVVAPILNDGNLIMVCQWRYATDNYLIEFPAGKLKLNEDPEVAIKRELKEETGYVASQWQYLTYIYTAPGFCSEKLYLYKATHLTPGEQDLDDGEHVEPFIISQEDAWKKVKNKEITDGKTVALLALIGANRM